MHVKGLQQVKPNNENWHDFVILICIEDFQLNHSRKRTNVNGKTHTHTIKCKLCI